MRSYLSGMPELKLGLNDKLLFEATGRRSAPGRSKGKAVEHILAELDANSGGKKYFPLYFGDDVSDEDVFSLLRERDGPGAGVLVDARARPRTSTAASYRVRTPADVHAMLARLPLPTDAAPAAASDDDTTFAP